MLLLTDSEIKEATRERLADLQIEGKGIFEQIIPDQRKVTKAQLKKVVEWGDEECFKHPFPSDLMEEEYNRKRHRCPECSQSLLKEIEDKP